MGKKALSDEKYPWRLVLKQRLFARHVELKCAEEIIRKSLKDPSQPPILLVSGVEGSGKTRFARSLKDTVESCHFAEGAFDSLPLAPYSGFLSAIEDFFQRRKNPDQDKVIKNIENEMSLDQIAVLLSGIPSLSTYLSPQSKNPRPNLEPNTSSDRFRTVFCSFLSTICSVQKPLVIFLDNLHFSNNSSMELLSHIILEAPIPGLFIIGAAPSDEELPLWKKVKSLEMIWQTSIPMIEMKALSSNQIREILSESFHSDMDSLNRTLVKSTECTFLHVCCFLSWLRDSGFLYPRDGQWDFQEVEFSLTLGETSVSLKEIVQKQIITLFDNSSAQWLRIVASCGHSFDANILEKIFDASDATMLLNKSIKCGLIEAKPGRKFVFCNETVRLQLIGQFSKEEQDHSHLKIARGIWSKTDDGSISHDSFSILNHFFFLTNHVPSKRERWAVASLCLHAAKHAVGLSSFSDAHEALTFGMKLMKGEDWRKQYDLSLALHNCAAEVHLILGNFDLIDALTEPVPQHAREPLHKVQASCAKIYSLDCQGNHNEAIAAGLSILEELGFVVPTRASGRSVFGRLRKIRQRVMAKSDEQILRMSVMTDESKLAILQILQLLFVSAFSIPQPMLTALLAVMSVEFTLDHGLSVFAAGSLSTLGMVVVGVQGVDIATRYGTIAMKLFEKFGRVEFLPRVNFVYYGVILPWRDPLKNSLPHLLHGYHIASQTGDMQFGCICGLLYCVYAIASGVSLLELQSQWYRFTAVMKEKNNDFLLSMTIPHIQLAHHYMGLSSNPLAAKGDLLDYDDAFSRAKDNNRAFEAMSIKHCRMELGYVFNDYELAYKWIITPKELETHPYTLELVNTAFFRAVVLIALGLETPKRFRKYAREVKRTIQQFQQWSKETPHNILEKFHLLKAEYHSLEGKNGDAYQHYLYAISLSRNEENLFTCAVAQERCGLHLLRKSDRARSTKFLKDSILTYV